MLRSTEAIDRYGIRATDGDIGRVTDLFFDDDTWVIRYLVVDTGPWLSNRRVLISPLSLARPNWAEKVLPLAITMAQVQNSPEIDMQRPVSRQHEIQWLRYYGYPSYWEGIGPWGGGVYPYMIRPDMERFRLNPDSERPDSERAYARAAARRHTTDDEHLRSCKAVVGYHVHAIDGDIGHVQGLLIDEDTWAIGYMIVNMSDWWAGRQVVVAPTWIRDVSWKDAEFYVSLTRDEIKGAPPYDRTAVVQRRDEVGIYDHYGRTAYWTREPKRSEGVGRREGAV